MMEGMQKMMAGMMGGDGEGLDLESMMANLGGAMGGDDEGLEGGDDLKARVRAQMAQMMNKKNRGGGALDDDEF